MNNFNLLEINHRSVERFSNELHKQSTATQLNENNLRKNILAGKKIKNRRIIKTL